MSKLCTASKFSAFIEQHLARPDTLGFLVGGVLSNNQTRTDSLNAYTQNIYGPKFYPFDATDASAGAVPLTATPCCITFGSIFDDKKREALSGSLEWRPNDSFKLIARRPVDQAPGPADRLQPVVLFPVRTMRRQPVWTNADRQQRGGHRGHRRPTSSRKSSTTPSTATSSPPCTDCAAAGSRPTGSSSTSMATAPPRAAPKAAPTPS